MKRFSGSHSKSNGEVKLRRKGPANLIFKLVVNNGLAFGSRLLDEKLYRSNLVNHIASRKYYIE